MLRTVFVLCGLACSAAAVWLMVKPEPPQPTVEEQLVKRAQTEYDTNMTDLLAKLNRREISESDFNAARSHQEDILADRKRTAHDPTESWCAVKQERSDKGGTIYTIPEKCGDGLMINISSDDRHRVVTMKAYSLDGPAVVELEHTVGGVTFLEPGKYKVWGYVFAKNPAPGKQNKLIVEFE